MTTPREEHTATQIAAHVSGAPEKQFTEAKQLAEEIKSLSSDLQSHYNRLRDFVPAAVTFVRTQKVSLETLGGIFKHVRTQYDTCCEMEKLLDTGQKPPSLRSIVEHLMAVQMHLKSIQSGQPCVVVAHGKKFIASGKSCPTIPDPDKSPQEFKILCDFLLKTGRPDMIRIGQAIGYRKLQDHLDSLAEDQNLGTEPWPECLKVQTTPSIRMSDAV